MSDLYAIKASTLTAIGDAIRSKDVKYVGGVDKSESEIIYNVSLDTNEITWKGSGNDLNYQEQSFNFYELLGDKYKLTKYLYCSFEYEGVDVSKFSVYFRNMSNYTDHTFINSYDGTIKEELYIPIASGEYRLQLNAKQKDIDNGATLSFTIKMYPCDENKMFIGLNKYTPLEMADAINNLMTIPDEALTITGNCNYKFAYGGWDWFINECGDKIITKDIYSANNMFINSTVKKIPFNINVDITTLSNICYIFGYMSNLEEVPYVIGGERTPPTSAYSGTIEMNAIFHSLNKVREIPNDFFWKMISNKEYWDKYREVSTRSLDYLFYGCSSLRESPDISMLGGAWTSQYSTIYSNTFFNCYALNTVENYPVCGKFSGNAMSGLVTNCNRIKDLTFMTNEDGTPKTAQWKSQTLDLSQYIGYFNGSASNITKYNSGITADKQVKDDATYQALKDDPDWFATHANYSRYNHTSAVNTINSLPDCSATGTNNIKFKGSSGALTDGGAINTLTEAEIAVASAKGWTVSFV